MKILILITKDKRQLLKLVQYNKLKKKANGKVSHLNKESNNIKVCKGNTKEKFNFIQSVYKKKQEFFEGKFKDLFSLEIKPYISGIFSFFNMEKADIKIDYLETEYHKAITENKHQVLQYNLISEPEGSKIFDHILNYVETLDGD